MPWLRRLYRNDGGSVHGEEHTALHHINENNVFDIYNWALFSGWKPFQNFQEKINKFRRKCDDQLVEYRAICLGRCNGREFCN